MEESFALLVSTRIAAILFTSLFQLAATGNYTLRRLATTLTDRGLTMRGRGGNPGGTGITAKYLSRVLRDRYILGRG